MSAITSITINQDNQKQRDNKMESILYRKIRNAVGKALNESFDIDDMDNDITATP